MSEPLQQDEWSTLEAELRRAVQHRQAAFEQMQETQREVEELMARARRLLTQVQETREEIARAEPPPDGAEGSETDG
jgi:predicted  nucleic acid-binding Zn-ribbon protein